MVTTVRIRSRVKEMNENRARELRKNMTDAERALWSKIRKRQISGYKFRRQQIIGRYIVDFVCNEKKLIIELDGGQHLEQAEYDKDRTAWLESQGFEVIRFWNHEVLTMMDVVLQEIFNRIDAPHL
jgi:very-short-patch-repair endonuclease